MPKDINNEYGYNPQQDENESQQKILMQESITLSAHERKTVHNIFNTTMEYLEKYVEIAGYYSDWDARKQIQDNGVIRKDIVGKPEKAEKSLSVTLFGLRQVLEDNPKFLHDELKDEFYRWISATRIDVNNCPERLKLILFGFNEILEGNGEKIMEDVMNRKEVLDVNSPDYAERLNNFYAAIQIPLDKGREQERLLKNKTHKDIKIESKFSSGNEEQGKKIFDQISGIVANSYKNFHHFIQKDQQSASSGDGGTPPGSLLSDKVDKITTEIDNFGRAKKQEIMLIRQGTRLNDFKEGKLNFNNNPVYKWNSFKVQQKFEIKNTLSENRVYLDKTYLTDDEISFVIKEFADNPSVWRIEPIKGNEYLIHSSARGNNNREIGTLIHSKEKFSEAEWAEVKETLELNKQYGIALRKLKGEISPEYGETREGLEIWAKELEKKLLINNIRKNADEWEIREEVITLDFDGGEKGKVLIRKTVQISVDEDYDLTGGLINLSNKFYRKDYFDDKELAEINDALKINDEDRQIIETIKSDVNSWEIKLINGNNWLVHKQAQKPYVESEIGQFLHPYQRFTNEEWTEIETALNNCQSWVSWATSSILPTNYGNEKNYSLKGVENATHTQPDNKISTGRFLGILGIITILIIGGVVVVKKRLFRKVLKSK
ncbi:protein of unknown function [endosymbiont DhMRE of Dentiscutata heterogama]|uniref:hypothetical protein n=1 Tax=endosymbiont DhMRE of Dentiscutata heterogama TaxID=1609546 RepID=UPI000631C20A|nr:hypothetical protein [endosymbiont DhMRE of Dentiscutata heterogama]CFW92715.1 protein of unknown function [endosymbiont DhMRE of Dentiscutata heterogama]